jgi:asparagine synthase (glutamine-hydrolysing)
MCGITGIAAARGPAPELSRLEAMNGVLKHRGPDDAGYHLQGGVGFGMRRLSIIDLTTGAQPLHNESGSVSVVFNGEIYNFRELRADLEGRGHRFSTHSDGEVIAHLWEESGPAFADQLNGMFAIALHDAEKGKVVLARDRVGVKPLFWTWQEGRLIFGSEIKAILASGEVAPQLDFDGLGQLLAWEYVPAPRTLFKSIFKLEPGHLLMLDLGEEALTDSTWWDLAAVLEGRPSSSRPSAVSPHALADRLDLAVSEATRRQLISDVPLGAFLSGGVDSSLVVAGMGEARAFSIGFGDASYDETRWASQIAEHLGVSHRVEQISPDAAALFDRLMVYLDDPIGDFSIFPTFLVSELARQEVKVALSGDGGDELFGGYETYVAQNVARRLGWLPRSLEQGLMPRIASRIAPRPVKKGVVNKAKRFLEGLQHPETLAHARWRLFLGPEQLVRLLTPAASEQMQLPVTDHIDRLRGRVRHLSSLDQELYVDFRSYLPDNCLVKVDRMSMATSLEVRVPLLDNTVIETAFALPPSLKVKGRKTKVLLKEVAARHLPRNAVYRPKEGFSMPMKEWLRQELRPQMEDLLSGEHLRQQGLFEISEVDRLKAEHLDRRANHSHILWSLMVFQDWSQRWAVSI